MKAQGTRYKEDSRHKVQGTRKIQGKKLDESINA